VTWLDRGWFTATFLVGVAFIAVLPPFQTNDEDSHWRRMWTVAQGEPYCDKIPEVANLLPVSVHFEGDHEKRHVAKLEYLREAWENRGYNLPVTVISTGCGYFPLGYLPSAIVAKRVAFGPGARPRVGGMLAAYYAARLANWIMVSLAVLLLALKVPWARHLTLFFYSIPEVLQQSVAINLDAFLFALTCVFIVLVFKADRWRTVLWMALVVTLMTMTKPIYAPLSLLGIPLMARLIPRTGFRWHHVLAAQLLFFLPLWARGQWQASIPSESLTGWGVGWVNPALQVAHLKEHPFKIVTLLFWQLCDLFTRKLMQGGWTSIFGAFGWSAFEMPSIGYYLLLVALVFAVLADAGGPPLAPIAPSPHKPWVARVVWWVPALGLASIFAGVILAMYIYFTKVGEDTVNGVQGRYYLVPLLISGVLAMWAYKRRHLLPVRFAKAAAIGPLIAALSCTAAGVLAVLAIRDFYW
jgi:uncharacterized membrane protein